MTFDEVVYAGGGNTSNYYLNNNATTKHWWVVSPNYYNSSSGVRSFLIRDDGGVDYFIVRNNYALRPSITLLSTTQITEGNGSISNPYTVK